MLLSEKNLFKYFAEVRKEPLPFSLSSLQKDRLDGRLGMPYRPRGRSIFYDPDEIQAAVRALPSVRPTRAKNEQFDRSKKPSKTEAVHAARLGISVRELRAKRSA